MVLRKTQHEAAKGENIDPHHAVELERLSEAFRLCLASEAGRRVVFWMLEQGAIYREPFTGQDSVTNYTIGTQAPARRLIAQLDAIEPRLYPQLLLDMAVIREADKAEAEARANLQKGNDDEPIA